jgi:hypothetical protein
MGQIKDEENKLLQEAAGLKGTNNIKTQLLGEAASDGITGNEAIQIIKRVLARLGKTETGKQSGAFGKPHKATDEYKAVKETVSGLHGY